MTRLFLHSYGLRYHYRHQEGFDVFSLIDLAADLRFDGVNVSCAPPDYVEICGRSADHLRRVRDHAQRRGIGIDLETRSTSPMHLADMLQVAATVGAGYLRTYTVGTEVGDARTGKAIEDLRTAAAFAEQAGIPILLENHEDLCGADVGSILAAVDSPWVCGLFDYVNSMLFAEGPEVALDAMAPWVRSAHLKDCVLLPAEPAAALPARLLGVPLGDGIAPVVELTRRLVAMGIDRICFENTWSYVAAFRSLQDGENRNGDGLRFLDRPLRGPGEFTGIDALRAADPKRVVQLEERTLLQSIAWLEAEIKPLLRSEGDAKSMQSRRPTLVDNPGARLES